AMMTLGQCRGSGFLIGSVKRQGSDSSRLMEVFVNQSFSPPAAGFGDADGVLLVTLNSAFSTYAGNPHWSMWSRSRGKTFIFSVAAKAPRVLVEGADRRRSA